ncbi:hypothetical protein CRYUN_Cryun22dG0048900 [Craigia yunnanensis]
MAEDISFEKLNQLVGNLAADNFISFSDNKIPFDGRGNMKALHITTTCKGYILPMVFIDNGSSLNIMCLSTLSKLPINKSYMKRSHTVGPYTYNVYFQVMDITCSYNYLIRRPWIHSVEAVPSSLHQKLKFITE